MPSSGAYLCGFCMRIDELLKSKTLTILDLGGGAMPYPNAINIDIRDLPEVDIVHDLTKFPWPLPDESINTIYAQHFLEHITRENGTFIKLMDEAWRILKPDGQFGIVVPYGGSHPYFQDPTHVNPIVETTLYYFDPKNESQLWTIYKPKPWKIVNMEFDIHGLLICTLQKRKDDPKLYDKKADLQT